MDFRSTPAKVFVVARHNGVSAEVGFAEGAAPGTSPRYAGARTS
jgi:hypothetical protein